jgi:type I restriction-modification system DNA methylase subunit
MATDPEIRAHLQWLGYLQPVGLVVSAPALAAAGAFVNKNIVREQQTLIALAKPTLNDFPGFCRDFLSWEAADLAGGPGGPDLPRDLDVALPEYDEVLSPTYAVPDPDQKDRWLMLIQVLPRTVDLDEVGESHRDDRHWHASPQARFDRLLRENDIPIGLLSNGANLRLVYAPPNESTGHLTFPVAAMCEVAGRPIVAALHMLLGADRLFTVPTKQRLPAILKDSRRYQNQVSTRLAEQIQAALWELLRGFQAANEARQGELLKDVLREAPQAVYGGLLGTLMRLVFILYAEDRGLLSDDPVYQGHYSVSGLFERLRDESARYPDTMDLRFGAWAQLLTLFRLIHDGAAHGSLKLPARHGRLFNPDTWDFLEGRREEAGVFDRSRKITPPRVSDGVVVRVLDNLMVLDGERISYRALDVEQIGSVYEAMMGYELRIAQGPSIGVRPDHVVVDIAQLLEAKPADRLKTLRDEAKCDLAGKAADAVKAARHPEELVAALGKKVSPRTKTPIAPGGLYLQPTEERRRSGSHYTPRSLTEPIVRTTLEPILKALGDRPRPEQILDLKVCDPAMGSGAFLVEACRYLGNALVRSWDLHGSAPKVPPDEDLHTHARRLIASRCLYGVDKNPFAVDLAKLSLWLATLAKDHPFTFLDHSLRHGDSLVGLSREQIASFHWAPEKQTPLIRRFIDKAIREAQAKRAAIHALGDEGDTESKARLHDEAVTALEDVRRAGDLVIAAFFGREKPKDREALRIAYAGKLQAVLDRHANPNDIDDLIEDLRKGGKPVPPFHWGIEFPEVFSRDNPGFDAFVGNPPFAGKNTLIASTRDAYPDWLKTIHEESHGAADLIAHFYRRAFNLLRQRGTFGLIATNTIAQGDTRASGLRWICTHGGAIYAARKRVKWPAPGAAVVVSVVHIAKGPAPAPCLLDGKTVDRITAFLFHDGGHEDPARLAENAGKSFIGSYVLGMGFTFDDDNPDATPLAEMERLIAKDPRNKERIFPYIGGEEVNDSPTHAHRRYVINFGEMTEEEARRWPDLMAIVEAKVKPQRLLDKRPAYRKYWWQYAEKRADLYPAIRGLDRVLVIARVSQHHAPTLLSAGMVYSEQLVVIATQAWTAFTLLQSRVHELWFRFFGSTHEERPRYTPSDCFETFPFAEGWETNSSLEAAGRAYYDFRADLMVRNGEGLTGTYNRFHDPEEGDPDILKLRELHEAMDRAVLHAYGWTEIRPSCDFFLDYEEEGAEDDDTKPTKKKKPWRYRWPDQLRDEVLAHLLILNRQFAQRSCHRTSKPGQ